MLNCIICDDNVHSLNRLKTMLESIFVHKNLEAKVGLTTGDPNSLLEYLKNNSVNVAFLDIDLKSNISGLDLAKIIRKNNKDIYIVFVTAHLEYGLMAYKFKTFDYLPKPVTAERLEDTVLRLIDDMNGNTEGYIRLDNNKTIIKLDNIQFIQKDGMKVVFHTNTRDYETYSSFKKILDKLPSNFVQCHKSYIVNLNKITDINISKCIISLNNNPNLNCYIGPKYKNHFMEEFSNANL